ncbi:MAG: histidine decarboxylase [Lentisphaerae bacterium]|nr:histidine decarboxylase [Lentisphaerota bacterium]
MDAMARKSERFCSTTLPLTVVLCIAFCFPGAPLCHAQKPGSEPALAGLAAVVKGAVGPFDRYCDGYGNAGASGLGYICAMTLDIGMVDQDMDAVLNGIVAYDRAEAQGAYIGQINMMVASSFCGLNGALWGYDLAKADEIASGKARALFEVARHDRKNIPVYSADPLLDSAARLFGTNEKRRFPLLPGSHVICAAKEYAAPGPKYIWSAIAISIAEDRAADSCLFIEDAGEASVKDAADLNAFGDGLLHKIAKCAIRCGEDNNALYKEIWISYRIKWIPEGQVGCALVAAPYLVLAKKAIPDGKPEGLLKMTISDWEKKISLAE